MLGHHRVGQWPSAHFWGSWPRTTCALGEQRPSAGPGGAGEGRAAILHKARKPDLTRLR